MRVQVLKYWDQVRSSFWFLPALMAVVSMAFAFVSVSFDDRVSSWLSDTLGWEFNGGAEGASAVLGAVAGSMITLAGVVFSMTLVALSLASSQLGPRLLRNFMRDRTTQVVLGTFVSTFLYCLLVLRTVRMGEEETFVPHLSVGLGVVFAVSSVGVVIYFIHHVSLSIQVNEIVARVGGELNREVDRLFPDPIADEHTDSTGVEEASEEIGAPESSGRPVACTNDGYVQFVDVGALLSLACEHDVVLRIERIVGEYSVKGRPLVTVLSENFGIEKVSEKVNGAFILGNQRTISRDVGFGIDQLAEVAVRALSPGINDPFTAMTCVDHLGSALCRLVTRKWPSPLHYDKDGQLRLVSRVESFASFLSAAFDQIRQYSRTNSAVMIRMLEALALVASFAITRGDQDEIMRHAGMIVRGAQQALPESDDLRAVDAAYQQVMSSCRGADERPLPLS